MPKDRIATGDASSLSKASMVYAILAAHQQRRILHVGDQTGRNVHAAMYRAASQHSRIKIWDQATVVELLCHEV